MGEYRPSDLQLYANNTTIHGIRDFVSSKSKVLKVIWGICLLAAGGLLGEEIHRTTRNYQTEPTSFDVKYVPMDTFPTIHVCVDNWFDDTTARSLGFEDQDIAYMCRYFYAQKCEPIVAKYQSQVGAENAEFKKSIKDKMEKLSLTTVGDMLNLITSNTSVEVSVRRTKPPLHPKMDQAWFNPTNSKVCYSISNGPYEPVGYTITMPNGNTGVLVVGEDPLGPQKYYFQGNGGYHEVEIWDVNKLTLLSKHRDNCNKDYGSEEACLSNCRAACLKCTYNLTSTIMFPYNNADFLEWVYNSMDGCTSGNSCHQGWEICKEKCNPCTVWDYQYRAGKRFDGRGTEILVTAKGRIKVSEEYYTYPTSSLVSNIGGLMGLFCGASLLSFIQAVVFWCDDGCRSTKVKAFHGQKAVEA